MAQQGGDYDGALEWYCRSLALNQQLGNWTGMAAATTNIGALLTEINHAAEAVQHNLSALSMRLELGLPEAEIDIHWPGSQRTSLV